jgi:hypothetical protein
MSSSTARVFIVGCPGSGKSTVASMLATDLAPIEVHELDMVAWEGGDHGRLLPYERRLEIADDLSAGPRWIAEGTYLGWTARFMERADVIVWMAVPLRIALWRVFWRHVRAELRHGNRYPGWRRLCRFMKAVTAQYRNRFHHFEPPDINIGPDNIKRELAGYSGKVVVGSNSRIVADVHSRLGSRSEPGSTAAGPATLS